MSKHKKLVDWDVKIPPAYTTKKDAVEMCKMLEGSKILKARISELEERTVIIITTEYRGTL